LPQVTTSIPRWEGIHAPAACTPSRPPLPCRPPPSPSTPFPSYPASSLAREGSRAVTGGPPTVASAPDLPPTRCEPNPPTTALGTTKAGNRARRLRRRCGAATRPPVRRTEYRRGGSRAAGEGGSGGGEMRGRFAVGCGHRQTKRRTANASERRTLHGEKIGKGQRGEKGVGVCTLHGKHRKWSQNK
jgi:hypothetical protein